MTVKEMKPVHYVRTGFFFWRITAITESSELAGVFELLRQSVSIIQIGRRLRIEKPVSNPYEA